MTINEFTDYKPIAGLEECCSNCGHSHPVLESNDKIYCDLCRNDDGNYAVLLVEITDCPMFAEGTV